MKIVYKIRLERKWLLLGNLGVNEKSFFLTSEKIYKTVNMKRIRECLNKIWDW